MRHQKSGPPARNYADRFDVAVQLLLRLLTTHGVTVTVDGTGMAYIATLDHCRIGGPNSRIEDTIRTAIDRLNEMKQS